MAWFLVGLGILPFLYMWANLLFRLNCDFYRVIKDKNVFDSGCYRRVGYTYTPSELKEAIVIFLDEFRRERPHQIPILEEKIFDVAIDLFPHAVLYKGEWRWGQTVFSPERRIQVLVLPTLHDSAFIHEVCHACYHILRPGSDGDEDHSEKWLWKLVPKVNSIIRKNYENNSR